jgi:hypothetical protein
MKKITTLLTIVLLQTATLFAVNENDTLSKQKQCFYDAKTEIENMLSGKIPLDYERAVFITENAYWNNKVDYTLFQTVIDFHSKNIKNLAEANRNEKEQNFKATLLETVEQKREKYQNLLNNWAIFKYITDTNVYIDKTHIYIHPSYKYSLNDPLGVINWRNSQVFNLLDNNKANCYAMTSFFKILAERLKTDASIGVAPGHVYITHIDQKGTHYNIELANKAFPGAGSIMTLTYTPVEAVRNGIAMRTLDLKQSVSLCLIYLAKGFEHKFDTKTDDFLYQCAETTLNYDSLNLNAMLLKAEVLEEKITNNNKTISQLQTDKEFKEYQNLIVSLFEKGYREMPLDMKNLIINRLQKDSIGLILTDHTPKGFQTINPKDDRYATLSWGMFDEVHEPKLIEQYGRTLLNTKTKKITKFVTADSLYNKYPIDPVVFAWQIDPLASKFPHMSPYSAFANNPILYTDVDGLYPQITITKEITGYTVAKVYGNKTSYLVVPTYKMIVEDVKQDGTRSVMGTYSVTRDGYYNIAGASSTKNNYENRAFEPAKDNTTYTAIEFEYPEKGIPALALRESGGSSLNAEPLNNHTFDDGTPLPSEVDRVNPNVAKGVMIHIGGLYEHNDGSQSVGGTYGCFSVVNDNQVYKTEQEVQDAVKNGTYMNSSTSNSTMNVMSKNLKDSNKADPRKDKVEVKIQKR